MRNAFLFALCATLVCTAVILSRSSKVTLPDGFLKSTINKIIKPHKNYDELITKTWKVSPESAKAILDQLNEDQKFFIAMMYGKNKTLFDHLEITFTGIDGEGTFQTSIPSLLMAQNGNWRFSDDREYLYTTDSKNLTSKQLIEKLTEDELMLSSYLEGKKVTISYVLSKK